MKDLVNYCNKKYYIFANININCLNVKITTPINRSFIMV